MIEQQTFVVLIRCLKAVSNNNDFIESNDSFDFNSIVEKLVIIHNQMAMTDGRHQQEKTKLVFNYLCSITSKTHLRIADQYVYFIYLQSRFSTHEMCQIF